MGDEYEGILRNKGVLTLIRNNRLGREAGFTLIELVLVIIVVAILSAGANVAMDGMSRTKLHGAGRRLISDLRYAQQVTLTKQIRHGIIFSANAYTVFENNLPSDPARNPQGGGDFIVDFTTGEFGGVTIATASPGTTLPGLLVKFTSRGEPLDGTNAPLTTATNQVTLTYKGFSRNITITPETGKVNN